MIRRPPRSTLFPTRRSSDLHAASQGPRFATLCEPALVNGAAGVIARSAAAPLTSARSEEHTSELQSLRHLVCRLLLEKKKNELPPTESHRLLTYAVIREGFI